MSSQSSSGTSGSVRAASSQQLAEKIKVLQRQTKLLVKASALVAGGKHTTNVVLGDGRSGEVKGKDITDLTRQLNVAQGSLKRDVVGLAKRRRNANNQGGQGFGNPKLYDERLRTFLRNAREELGQINVNEINRVRQETLNRAFAEKRPGAPVPQLPAAALTNPGSNYLVDQLSLVNGFGGVDAPFGAASILTPLMCIYAAMTEMHKLAQPPQETVQYLKFKYAYKMAAKSSVYKIANKHLGKGAKPVLDEQTIGQYLNQQQLNAIFLDDSVDAPWRNKQYLGATPTMENAYGAELFAEAQQRDMTKYAENQADANARKLNKNGRPLARRVIEEKPYVTASYFPYAELQVFSSLLAYDDTTGKTALAQAGASGFLDKTTQENAQLREQLSRETTLLKAFLSYLNATGVKGRSGKYNREILNLL